MYSWVKLCDWIEERLRDSGSRSEDEQRAQRVAGSLVVALAVLMLGWPLPALLGDAPETRRVLGTLLAGFVTVEMAISVVRRMRAAEDRVEEPKGLFLQFPHHSFDPAAPKAETWAPREPPPAEPSLRLPGVDLRDGNLADADLERVDFSGAILTGAQLTGANLRACILVDADLRNADLRSADLREADLRGAKLQSAAIAGARLGGAHYDLFTDWPHLGKGAADMLEAEEVRL